MPWDFWLILVFLGVVIPWRGHVRLQKLLALPAVDTKDKLALYAATIAFQWLICGAVAWRAITRGLSLDQLGLASRNWGGLLAGGIGGAVFIGGLQWLNLRRIGKMQGAAPELLRKLAEKLLPANLVEYLPYSALAITAGVCEEFIYRGFVLAALLGSGLPLWSVVILSSVLFGLAHAYQGRGGIISTGVLGIVLALGRLAFSSLVPVMMWHAGLDLAAGAAAPKYLLSGRKDNSPGEVG